MPHITELLNKLNLFPDRSVDRKQIIQDFANLYGVSPNTVYRSLREIRKPKTLRRSDAGSPRGINKKDLEKYCQIIAALKIRS